MTADLIRCDKHTEMSEGRAEQCDCIGEEIQKIMNPSEKHVVPVPAETITRQQQKRQQIDVIQSPSRLETSFEHYLSVEVNDAVVRPPLSILFVNDLNLMCEIFILFQCI